MPSPRLPMNFAIGDDSSVADVSSMTASPTGNEAIATRCSSTDSRCGALLPNSAAYRCTASSSESTAMPMWEIFMRRGGSYGLVGAALELDIDVSELVRCVDALDLTEVRGTKCGDACASGSKPAEHVGEIILALCVVATEMTEGF